MFYFAKPLIMREFIKSWKRNAAKDEERNFTFIRSLKMSEYPEKVDEAAKKLDKEAFEKLIA